MKVKLTDWCEKTGKKYRRALRDFSAGTLPNAFKDEHGRIWVELSTKVLYSCGNDDLFKLKSEIQHDSFWSDSGDRSALGLALAEPNMGTFIIKGLSKLEESEKNLMLSLLKAKNVELIEVKTVK